jgi:uncharacterized protein YndB with AHSA1/START domain
MKWFLIILGGLGAVVVLAALILLALGQRADAARLQAAIEIDRPPAEVQTWLNEPDKLRRWVSWLLEVRNLTPGARRVGSRSVWLMDDPNNKQRMEIAAEVTEYQPGRRVVSRLEFTGGFTGQQIYTLTPLGAGDRTRLEHDARYEFSHWFATLLKPLIRASAQKKLLGDLARLKQAVEATPRGDRQPAAAPVATPPS